MTEILLECKSKRQENVTQNIAQVVNFDPNWSQLLSWTFQNQKRH